MKAWFGIFLCASMGCGGCGGATPRSESPSTAVVDPAPTASLDPEPAGEAPSGVGGAINDFGVDLYKRALADTRGGNFTVSPASIWLALAMTDVGARGTTHDEMARVLRSAAIEGDIHDAAGPLLASWNPAQADYTLRVVNRLFPQQGFSLARDFTDRVRIAYGTPLEPLDFEHDPEGARRHINAYVEAQTEDRIHELVPLGGVDASTRLVLTNAVYFLGKWLAPFEHSSTYDAPFFVNAGSHPNVPTMHQTETRGFVDADTYSALEMPYVGGALSMVFVLPKERDGLAGLEQQLDGALLERIVSSLAPQRVEVALPKFRVEPASSLELDTVLSEMGMPTAFSGAADFSGMTTAASLQISQVFHKAFVRVDEDGTEAAAATAVVMMEGAARMPSSQATFHADHPFLFLLRDMRTGAVLFIGRVADPRVGAER